MSSLASGLHIPHGFHDNVLLLAPRVRIYQNMSKDKGKAQVDAYPDLAPSGVEDVLKVIRILCWCVPECEQLTLQLCSPLYPIL